MMFEIALTRVLAVVLRYHYVYVVVSVAICGLGLGGIFRYYVLQRLGAKWMKAILVLSAACFGLAIALTLAILLLTPFTEWLEVQTAISLVTVLPYFFAGLFLATAFEVFSDSSGTLYFADLVGAALATLLVLLVLEVGGGINACLVSAVLAAVAAAALVVERPKSALMPFALVVLVGLGVLAGRNVTHPFVQLKALGVTHGDAAYVKPLYRELAFGIDGVHRVYSEWNAFARTDVVRYKPEVGGDTLYVYTDGDVPTTIEHFNGDLETQRSKQFFIGFLPYYLHPAPERVLSLGSGGGMDVLLGLLGGAKRIDCVEINPSIPHIVQLFGEFSGNPYDYEGVNLYITEGRSFVHRSKQRYDLLYMALTKTATTASLGMSLVESYVHTVNAFRDYFQHLEPDGMLAFIMQAEPLVMRGALSMGQALVELGETQQDALHSLLIVAVPEQRYGTTPYRFLVLAKRSPFTRQEAERLAKAALACGLRCDYVPWWKETGPLEPLLQGKTDFLHFARNPNYNPTGLNVQPVYDDAPFYVDLSFGVPAPLIKLAWLIGGLLGGFLVIVLASRKYVWKEPALPVVPFIAYFAFLGVGFMLVELSLLQKSTLYLGYPTLTLSVVLFALLLGTGLGSLLSQALPVDGLKRAIAASALLTACGAGLYNLLLPGLFSATLHWSLVGRSLLLMVLLLPLGAVMGVLFPSGLRLVGVALPRDLPWMWGVNGFASILGSVACMAFAKLSGFSLALYLGAAIYLLVVPLAWCLRKRRTGAPGLAALQN